MGDCKKRELKSSSSSSSNSRRLKERVADSPVTGSPRRLEAFGYSIRQYGWWYRNVNGSIAPGKLCAPNVALRGWKLKDEPRYDVVNRKSYFYEVPSHIIGTGWGGEKKKGKGAHW
ncbi:hypothetical protein M0802_005440 [Mischocyttarus mexicanus]|nr:hypothetical protein M0802_005440 [Mischocyttarus mexicanus]